MKKHPSPRASAMFKAVFAGVPLGLVLPSSPIHAANTHTATLNGTAIGDVKFSGFPAGTDNLTAPIAPFISNFATYELK